MPETTLKNKAENEETLLKRDFGFKILIKNITQMKSKEELKRFFENGDIPKQEEFWEWQESYWHKDEKILADKIDYDFSKKADLVNGKVPAYQLPDTTTNDTFQDVTNRGNATNQQIKLNESILEYNAGLTSHRFGGNSTSNTIGSKTVIFGHQALNENSTGSNNSAFGYHTLMVNTTGHRNTAVGIYSLESNNTGWNNTAIGNSSGARITTGYDNITIGRTSGYGITGGKNNITIGNMVGITAGSIVDNNIIIGSGISGGSNAISNKLIIHQTNVTATSDNPTGTYIPLSWENALIFGDFSTRWLTLNSSLQVTNLPNATGDSSFEKNIVAKTDGTFGLADKPFKTYTALLDFNQNTFDPAIRVLENTLVGDIVWTRLSAGQYEGKLSGGFLRNKTWIHTGANEFGEHAYCIYLDNNTVLLKTVNAGGDPVNFGGMFGILEIRVYQ